MFHFLKGYFRFGESTLPPEKPEPKKKKAAPRRTRVPEGHYYGSSDYPRTGEVRTDSTKSHRRRNAPPAQVMSTHKGEYVDVNEIPSNQPTPEEELINRSEKDEEAEAALEAELKWQRQQSEERLRALGEEIGKLRNILDGQITKRAKAMRTGEEDIKIDYEAIEQRIREIKGDLEAEKVYFSDSKTKSLQPYKEDAKELTQMVDIHRRSQELREEYFKEREKYLRKKGIWERPAFEQDAALEERVLEAGQDREDLEKEDLADKVVKPYPEKEGIRRMHEYETLFTRRTSQHKGPKKPFKTERRKGVKEKDL